MDPPQPYPRYNSSKKTTAGLLFINQLYLKNTKRTNRQEPELRINILVTYYLQEAHGSECTIITVTSESPEILFLITHLLNQIISGIISELVLAHTYTLQQHILEFLVSSTSVKF